MKHVTINLLDKSGEVQYGLNWGQREGRDKNQAYLQLDPSIYKTDYFPPKGKFFIVKTDDGKTMIFSRAQKDAGTALQTPENNSIIGLYLRQRMGVVSESPITKEDIKKYGRSYIDFYKIDDMNYKLDFSNGSHPETQIKSSNQPLQQIFYGAPGTGKSFTIDDMADDDHSVRTTFHPDSDYASFVGAYKPTMAPMPINAFVGTTVHHAKNAENEKAYENKIVYKYVPQAFLKAYVAAWKDLDNDYYLVIEEINRGNCAQIFGDLFQLLDRNSVGSSSYAIHADNDIRQFLSSDDEGFAKLEEGQKSAIEDFILHKDNGSEKKIGAQILSGELLLLPPNLHIWATMNTSDQSLFPIDSAFKRRWDWKYIPIDYKPTDKKTGQPIDWKFRIGDNLYSWGQFLGKINPEIYTLTESSDKQMGYFFAKADRSTGIISEDVFLNKVLFYLWTDVFKDFDVSSELFKNKKANRSFRFTDFFEDPVALENFIANFNLDAEEVEAEADYDKTETEDSGAGNRIKITVKDDGDKIFCESKQRATIIEFIKYLGLENVSKISPTIGNKKIVFSIEEAESHPEWISNPNAARIIKGTDFYYNSEFNVTTKIKQIKEIAERLGRDIDIELIKRQDTP